MVLHSLINYQINRQLVYTALQSGAGAKRAPLKRDLRKSWNHFFAQRWLLGQLRNWDLDNHC
jgi:hypothetical protein